MQGLSYLCSLGRKSSNVIMDVFSRCIQMASSIGEVTEGNAHLSIRNCAFQAIPERFSSKLLRTSERR
ncbi:Cat Eye Syndrome Critical Region Protein 9-Like [Manis pentadactyla]|nr:Cat Eye Syndrome Critical Region Protein 9-Like [Manis pentadactyla]